MDSTGIINGFRTALQELLVPEIKVIQVELKHLNEKYAFLDKRIDLLHEEMTKRFEVVDKRFEAMQLQVDKRFDAMQKEMNERFLRVEENLVKITIIQEKILDKLDVDKRMTRVETLIEQILKKAA